jgi:hypothetical protein
VVASLLLLLAVLYLPFLQPIFDTVPLGLREWSVVLPLLFVPAVIAEINKALESKTGGGRTKRGHSTARHSQSAQARSHSGR